MIHSSHLNGVIYQRVLTTKSLGNKIVHGSFFKHFLSAMSLRRTFKDLNSCPPLLSDKILTKASIPSDSNKLAYFNNIKKRIPPKKILPKKSPQKILPKKSSQKIPLKKIPPKRIQEKSKKFPRKIPNKFKKFPNNFSKSS